MKKILDSITSFFTKHADHTQINSDGMYEDLMITIQILMCPFIVLGVFANTVNILVFWTLDFSSVSNISLFSLSLVDLVSIVFVANGLIYNNRYLTVEILMQSCYLSMISNSLHYSVMAFSSWNTAVISMERCCCIMLPMKVRS